MIEGRRGLEEVWGSGGSWREKEEDWAEGRVSDNFFIFLDFWIRGE
jgi:hypothetical protein